MVVRVANVGVSVGAYADTMRTIEPCICRVAWPAIAAETPVLRTPACYCRDRLVFEVDQPDRLILGIDQENSTESVDCNALRTVEDGRRCGYRLDILVPSARATPRDMVNQFRVQIQPPDAVPFAQTNPKGPVVRRDKEGPWTCDGIPTGYRAIAGLLSFACADYRFNDPSGHVNAAYAVISNIGNVDLLLALIDCDAVGSV